MTSDPQLIDWLMMIAAGYMTLAWPVVLFVGKLIAAGDSAADKETSHEG